MAKLKQKLLPVAAAISTALLTQSAFAVSGEDFEFHGYMRSGIGANFDSGGDQVCFQLPGVGWKYRLGNECETYFETSFGANLYQGDAAEYFKLYFTLAYVVEGETDFEQFSPALRELWIESGNVAGGIFEGARFWAGKRFYRRHDVHINDFFFWDVSGPGAGVEDINLGNLGAPGLLAASVFRGVNDDFFPQVFRVSPVTGNPEILPASELQNTDDALTRFDLRWYGIETNPGGQLTLGIDARFRTEDDEDFDGHNGVGINILHFQDNPLGWGGFNKVIFQYGFGPAARLGQAGGTFRFDPETGNPNADGDEDVQSFRVVEQVLFEPHPDWSFFASGVYENNQQNDGLGSVIGGTRDWWSFGMRPIYYFSDYFNIAAEVGFDYIDFSNQDSRRLTKFTLAPQLSAGRGFWARPLIRAFVTYADWDDDAEDAATGGGGEGIPGSISDPALTNTDGWSIGIQAESWW